MYCIEHHNACIFVLSIKTIKNFKTMRTQLIETESSFYVSFKRIMYALMVIVVAIAIPLLSYLELSYKDNANIKKEEVVKQQTFASSAVKQNTVKL